MVKKLIKHEMLAFARPMLPILVILFGIAALTRGIQLFENDSVAYNIIIGSSVLALAATIGVCLVMTVVIGVTRFYRNLFTREGYLSFTLPVTPAQHIFAKVLVAVLFSAIVLAAIFLAFAVATAGELFEEIMRTAGYLIRHTLFEKCGVHAGFYIAEGLLLLLVAGISQYLLYDTCIAVGQLARKNRVLAAFGAYFGYYIICQMLETVLMIVVTSGLYFVDSIGVWIEAHVLTTVHIALCTALVWYTVMSLVYFLITHTIIRKKLNLE